MSNPPPIPPIPSLGDESGDQEQDGVPTREVDGERELDPDADDAQVDSAEADRIAAEGD